MPSQENKIPLIGKILRLISGRFGITTAFKETEFKIEYEGFIIEAIIWDPKGNLYYGVYSPKSLDTIYGGFNALEAAEHFLIAIVNQEIKELFKSNNILLKGVNNG